MPTKFVDRGWTSGPCVGQSFVEDPNIPNLNSIQNGFALVPFPIPSQTSEWVDNENWEAVYEQFGKLTQPGGSIYQLLRQYCDFKTVELMISIRESKNEWEEDGIWHDDGSRVFAFSLSLTRSHQTLKGGEVEIRKKNSEVSIKVPTPEFGTAICFLTGVWGYEHRTRKVEQGRRIILVGWCER